MINNEITTQVTRKLHEIRKDLNTQILEVISSAIAEKVLPSIQNVLGVQNSGLNANRDHQCSGLDRCPEDHFGHMDNLSRGLNKGQRDYLGNTDHWSKRLNKGPGDYSGHMDYQSGRQDEGQGELFGQVDNRSSRPVSSSKNYLGILAHGTVRLENKSGERFSLEEQHEYTKLNPKFSSQGGLNRENSLDSQVSDQDCDMVTGANPTLHTVPEFLTGRPMQSQEPLQNSETTHSEPQDPTQPVLGTSLLNTTTDPPIDSRT